MVENQAKQESWNEQAIPETESKISNMWKEFSGNSTLHGLRHAVLGRSVYLRGAWCLLVLGAFAFLTYSTVNSWKRYLQYQTTFKVSEVLKSSLTFPMVTICSSSIADKKRLFTHDDDQDFLNYGLNISACAATANVRAQMNISCGFALLCACVNKMTSYIEGCDKSVQEKVIHALRFHQVDFNLEDFLLKFSQPFKEIVYWCIYGISESDCTPYFKHVITDQGEVCYSFNSNMTNPNESYYHGAEGGLDMALKIQRDRIYIPRYTEGFTVFLNEQRDVMPVTGINAGSGLLTSISLKMQKFKFENDPYGAQCGSRKLKGTPFYSRAACFNECWSNHFYNDCACRPVGIGNYNDSIPCYSIHANCTRAATVSFSFSCDCPIACDVTTYNTEVSYGTLPHTSVAGVRERFGDVHYSRESYALIQIGFKDLSYTQREEKLAFEKTSLFGEIGGNMGLMLGCSVLTVVELIEFLFSLPMLRLKGNNIDVR